MSRRGILWSQINHNALIVGFRVQMGDSFTHCHGQFTVCCIWQNARIHTDTVMPVYEAIRIQALFLWWPAGVYEQTIMGLIVQPQK